MCLPYIYKDGDSKMNEMNEFARRIRQLRENANLSQKELAYILNIERTTLASYEIGRRMPDAGLLCAIADYFRVSVDYILGHDLITK